jgi:predicted aconitase
MRLNAEEQSILQGGSGPVLQKIMSTLLRYGEALDAERLVDIEGSGHFALHHVLPGIGPRLEMLDELAEAGLKTKFPFTLDPAPPLDFQNLGMSEDQENGYRRMFDGQRRFEQRMSQLGLRDADAWTCTPYLSEVGNVPVKGQVLAWSESSAVVYANSVIGARTNRNAVILDLLSNIVGKTPLAGLLTDEGRKARWLIDVRTSTLPHAQLLGGAIGKLVVEDVPYVTGLDRFLGFGLNAASKDYLKEMGAACAALGAVGLYHVENVTPEAMDAGHALLARGCRRVVITDQYLQELYDGYPVMWAEKNAKPQRCLIGCPHVSLRELHWWTERIDAALAQRKADSVAIPTTIVAAPQVIAEFKRDRDAFERLQRRGVRLSSTCLEACMQNRLVATEAVVTNSNKLRAFSAARMFTDEKLLQILSGAELPE